MVKQMDTYLNLNNVFYIKGAPVAPSLYVVSWDETARATMWGEAARGAAVGATTRGKQRYRGQRHRDRTTPCLRNLHW